MILGGKAAITRRIISGLHNAKVQAQPCGVDLSLHHVSKWTSAGIVDFSNQHRANANVEKMPSTAGKLHLSTGNYLAMFNETVDMPLDIMGQIFLRSSLWRCGALLSAGVMDSGYRGAVGAMLQVVNPHGITFHEHARLAQMVFHEMDEEVEGYDGVYQGASKL
ncbi:dUTP diphosphatase Dut [Lecanosticta acicola]|uniref:dUTP diphosphatase Dut n=1 Tax=Lecanosticta acicola TaxID=111012 RepID=A0AAI8YUU2_9PEZI|nr:dUTP diphosphatase Dut [Lecanosticta acicola]